MQMKLYTKVVNPANAILLCTIHNIQCITWFKMSAKALDESAISHFNA